MSVLALFSILLYIASPYKPLILFIVFSLRDNRTEKS